MTHDLNLDVPDSGAVFAFGKSVPPKFYIRNDSVVSAACGEGHALVATSSGRVFAFGQNDYGQLGLGHRNPQLKPACVKRLREANHRALRVACGPTHSLVALEGGGFYGFGNNSDGQLIGESADWPEPVELKHLAGKEVKELVAGRSFSLLLTKQGELFAWGSNAEGCLGQGAGLEESRDVLVQVELPDRAVSVAAGAYHVVCVVAGGQVYAWGESEGGKLGLPGSEEYFYTPQRVPLPDGQMARSVACGLQHTLVLTEAGRLVSCGTGECGQLGLGTDRLYAPLLTPVVAVDDVELTSISAGERHSACVSGRSGHLFTFGDALHGKLGPVSRRGQTNQYRPFRTEALARLRVRRAVCGTLLTLVLAAPRSPDDPELAALVAAEGEVPFLADDPLDPISAMSPRPLSRNLAATMPSPVESDGLSATLLLRRSTRSRMKYHESNRQSLGPTDSVDGGGANGDLGNFAATFDLLRPVKHAKKSTAEEEIIQTKTQSATECQPGVLIDSPTHGGSAKAAEPETSDTVEDGPIPPHVMAITQFDNLLEPPGELSPDTEEDQAAEAEVKELVKPLPRKRIETKVKVADQEDDATYADLTAPKKKGSGKRRRPKLPPPPQLPPPQLPPPSQQFAAQTQKLPQQQPAPAASAAAAAAPAAVASAAATQAKPANAAGTETSVAAAAPPATEAPQQTPPAPQPIAEGTAPPAGLAKGVGCGRGRRQPPPASATPVETAGAAVCVDATDGPATDSAPAEEAGSGGAVSGVGCGGRRRKPPPASAAKPAEAPAASATAEGGEAPASAEQNGTAADSAAPEVRRR